MIRHLLAAVLALSAAGPAAAATAPHIGIDSFAELKTPLPYPYTAAANANADVARAKARARKAGKLLLIDLGGNWCADCRILSGVMERADLKPFLNAHYTTVLVDVGRFGRNLQVPAHYGITDRLEGVPALLVVDPKTDKLLNAAQVTALADARNMNPQALADWLAQWVK